MSNDPCLPAPAPAASGNPAHHAGHPSPAHHRLPHHVGRHLRHHAAPGAHAAPAPEPSLSCGKHFADGHAGALAPSPVSHAIARIGAAKAAVLGGAGTALLAAAASAALLAATAGSAHAPAGPAQPAASGTAASPGPSQPTGLPVAVTPAAASPHKPHSLAPGPAPAGQPVNLPEPPTIALLTLAAAIAAAARRRARHTKS